MVEQWKYTDSLMLSSRQHRVPGHCLCYLKHRHLSVSHSMEHRYNAMTWIALFFYRNTPECMFQKRPNCVSMRGGSTSSPVIFSHIEQRVHQSVIVQGSRAWWHHKIPDRLQPCDKSFLVFFSPELDVKTKQCAFPSTGRHFFFEVLKKRTVAISILTL